MNEPKKTTRRYMDFIGPSRTAATDPLISRPVARRVADAKNSKQVAAVDTNRAEAQNPSDYDDLSTVAARPTSSAKSAPRRQLDYVPVRPVSSSRPNVAGINKASTAAVKTYTYHPVKDSTITVRKDAEKPLVSRKNSLGPKEYYAQTKAKTETVEANKTAPKTEVKEAAPRQIYAGRNEGASPFLSSYNIDKRPLSNSVPAKNAAGTFERVSYLGVKDTPSRVQSLNEAAEEKASEAESKKPVRIIDDTRQRAGLPPIVIILLTMLAGAAAGAGVYFLLPR